MKHLPPAGLAHLEQELARLAELGLLRRRPAPYDPNVVSFCSNDYLGLAGALGLAVPAGAGASRLVSGEHPEHVQLELALAHWLEAESSLLFTSGFAANAGLVPALADGPDDLILSDALNHASLVDGCRLARAKTVVYPHLDVGAVHHLLATHPARRRYVITESYFSMDADSPDLRALRDVCTNHGAALIVDEAHALGVLGPDGTGLLREQGVEADVLVGTLGKSFGGQGAFVVGSRNLTDWLWNRARSFVFSTGLSPVLAAAGLLALHRIREGAGLRRVTLERASQLRAGLRELGYVPLGYGHIVPWQIGESGEAVRIAASLRAKGFAVQAIRPPSVPAGTARIRLTTSSRQTAEDIDRLLTAIRSL